MRQVFFFIAYDFWEYCIEIQRDGFTGNFCEDDIYNTVP